MAGKKKLAAQVAVLEERLAAAIDTIGDLTDVTDSLRDQVRWLEQGGEAESSAVREEIQSAVERVQEGIADEVERYVDTYAERVVTAEAQRLVPDEVERSLEGLRLELAALVENRLGELTTSVTDLQAIAGDAFTEIEGTNDRAVALTKRLDALEGRVGEPRPGDWPVTRRLDELETGQTMLFDAVPAPDDDGRSVGDRLAAVEEVAQTLQQRAVWANRAVQRALDRLSDLVAELGDWKP